MGHGAREEKAQQRESATAEVDQVSCQRAPSAEVVESDVIARGLGPDLVDVDGWQPGVLQSTDVVSGSPDGSNQDQAVDSLLAHQPEVGGLPLRIAPSGRDDQAVPSRGQRGLDAVHQGSERTVLEVGDQHADDPSLVRAQPPGRRVRVVVERFDRGLDASPSVVGNQARVVDDM